MIRYFSNSTLSDFVFAMTAQNLIFPLLRQRQTLFSFLSMIIYIYVEIKQFVKIYTDTMIGQPWE
jgi:hypothetical protein